MKRRTLTLAKLAHRVHLLNALGMKGGTVYAKHREKICSSPGYMRTGNVSHYVRVKPAKKTRSRDRYGKVFKPAKRDAVKIDKTRDMIDDENK